AAGPVGEGEGPLGRDEEVVDDVVAAAAAGQAGGVPGVDDLDVGLRHEGDAPLRLAVGAGDQGAVVEGHGAGRHDLGVVDAAGEGEAAGEPVAAGRPVDVEAADGRDPAGGHGVEIGIEGPPDGVVEEGAVEAAVG